LGRYGDGDASKWKAGEKRVLERDGKNGQERELISGKWIKGEINGKGEKTKLTCKKKIKLEGREKESSFEKRREMAALHQERRGGVISGTVYQKRTRILF